ncbi:PAS domain S-box protein [Ancylomarina sp. 16SWW S1-10-2]|uniref:PAS domain S-box protein n=1 Tax=Ancylomarina sp. 16SWW S1-10-2 TaxID=2499681 RepID=UPI0012AE8780|nr:PAS domain S-box protein [Ancylomarina sp. 16SWW S1-10-2]MRT91848.1 PAS domain S-box protein [Ancylomarina sp. 16SWW S1-10-2]
MDQENKYKNLFSSTSTALVVFEPVFNSEGNVIDAKYIDMNANNEEIIGYKKMDLIGRTILEVFPKIEDFLFENFDSVVKTRKSIRFKYFHTELGKYLLLKVFPLDDYAFAISYNDVSDQEILKQKLDESERRYKTIFHESSSIMLIIDPDNGAIIDANSTAIKFYGFSKTKLLRMNMSDINTMSSEDVQREIDLVAQKKKKHLLFKHRIASGEIRDVEVYSGTVKSNGQTMLYSVLHDVTKSREALEKVNRLSMAVEQSPVAIVITDLNGDMLYCNPKHCEITGYKEKELIGHNSRLLKSGKFSKDVYVDLWKTITTGNKWQGEFFNKKKDGSFYWELAFIAPIKNDEGEIVNYIKIGEDISERKRLENKLEHSILKAEESDKLKSSFLANLSHEVRTPLNGIMGFTNMMISDGISEEERKEFGSYVESSGRQLMATMDNILKLSMIEIGEMSVKYSNFDINSLFSDIEIYYSSEVHDKGLEFKLDCSCKSMIRNDKKRIRQVLDCLIQNAIKFTSHGQITIKGECNHKMLSVLVEDTGMGIAAQDHNKVFDRFMQGDNFSTRQFDGSGLGLAISKEIVILLGGEIWVESEIGKGSKFIFTIPNVPEDVS